MNKETPEQLFRDPDQKPDDVLFRRIPNRKVYEVIKMIYKAFSAAGIDFGWRYYKDGKAWLGKATFRKKTVVWISVWDNFIKAGFYFTDKTRPAVLGLDIDKEIKSSFAHEKPVGKIIPLILDIRNKAAMRDFITLLHHKKSLG